MSYSHFLVLGVVVGMSYLLQPAEAASPSAGKPLHFRAGRFDPVASQALRPAAASIRARPGELWIVQFADALQPDWRGELEQRGLRLIAPVPVDGFVVRMGEESSGAVANLPYVRWMGRYRPELKLDPRLNSRAQGRVRILMAPGAAPGDLALARRMLSGLRVRSSLAIGDVLEADVAAGTLTRLAESEAVLWIEPAPAMKLFDEISTKIVAGDDGAIGTPALSHQRGFDGAGVTVSVADSGLHNGDAETMHPDLAGRVDEFFHYGSLEDAADEHSHGTHVAGIVAGNAATGEADENGYLYGLGVAPGAHIIAQRLFDGLGGYEAPPSFEALTRDAVRAGADIGSNSWGDDTQGRYDLSAAEFDALVRDADALRAGDQPYILEFSAGNAGPGEQTIGSPAVAKNVIATGASENNRFDFFIYADGQETMADFSSRGPCEDGRIKPDVVAPGTWIASLQSASATDENAWLPISPYYMYQGGTSQAGPQVSGAAAVFVQYYRARFGVTPSPALVKAALINSAVDMEDGFTTGSVPNNDEGWGRVDLTGVIESDMGWEFVNQDFPLASGGVHEQRVVVATDAYPLKVTLAYTDVPGFPGVIPALVNDLDLEMEGPDGTQYRGNQFEEGESIPGPAGRDSVNNVEGILLSAPAPGEYVLRVRARSVIADARLDVPGINQDFAITVSGDLPTAGVGVVFFDRQAYSAPGVAQVKLADPNLVGETEVEVLLMSTTESTPEVLLLQASSRDGVYTNAIVLTTDAVAADGRLTVADGDELIVTYQDAEPLEERVGFAVADLAPPLITGVTAVNRFGRILVGFETDEPSTVIVRYGTNVPPSVSVTNSIPRVSHEIGIRDVIPGVTYRYEVEAIDLAGNRAVDDNGGAGYIFVPAEADSVLLVDAYFPSDPIFGGIDIPWESYTDVLDAIGLSYDVWDVAERGSPSVEELRPFRAVIWRINDNPLSADTLSMEEQNALTAYVNDGGGLFLPSMEIISRLGAAAFRTNVLQVARFDVPGDEDYGVPAASGADGDPVSDGLSYDLDYNIFDSEILQLIGQTPDVADTFTPTTNAVPIFREPTGGVCAIRSRPGALPGDGRVVFLAFPWDAIPAPEGNLAQRTELLTRVLDYLAPGADGRGSIALGSPAYTLPSRATIELGDTDLAGAGSEFVRVFSSSDPAGIIIELLEVARRGVFRGGLTLVSSGGTAGAGELLAAEGDEITVEYADASSGLTINDSAIIDTESPEAFEVAAEPDYQRAIISWFTSEPTDALVQFGESAFLERTAYDPVLDEYHELELTGLRPDRIYHYQVTSRDAAGNATITTDEGRLFTFRTLQPLGVPWLDTLEGPSADTNWVVFNSDGSQVGWELGVPSNGMETEAHSPVRAWGSNLRGEAVDAAESFLISPAIDLTGGNVATLSFWHSYDFQPRGEFDILELGELSIVTNAVSAPLPLATYFEFSFGWEQETFDLTPYLGNVIYLVWHYFEFSLEGLSRPGWLLDDIEVSVENEVRANIEVANNLSQSRFTVSGPVNRLGAGSNVVLTNLPLGEYTVTWDPVVYYETPEPVSMSINDPALRTFHGVYEFADTNDNGMSDSWEQEAFGSIDPGRTQDTDSDEDGFTDLAEFVAGTDPMVFGSLLQAVPPLVLGSDLRFQWASIPGRSYQWQVSDNLLDWGTASEWIRASTSSSVLLLPRATEVGHRFYRLEVKP